jgi:hypothetical protein
MRNPDRWQLPERPREPAQPLNGGLVLAVALNGMTDLQDCALSGRSNCQ